MDISSESTLELLPDEMMLEICRYLHGSHVLYSFFNLNTRLNQTITAYRQHVWLRRLTFKQLLNISHEILPQIGTFVLSMKIHRLHQASFPPSFSRQMCNIFPRLQFLTLSSWTGESLFEFTADALQGMEYLQQLAIQELDRSPSIKDSNLVQRILNIKTNQLTNVIFDYDCDAFDLISHSLENFLYSNILNLTIQLKTLADFSYLVNFIPNIRRLDVTIRGSSLESVPFRNTLLFLIEFSLWANHWCSMLEDIAPLIQIVPAVEQLSLTLATRDLNLIDGRQVLAVLPPQLRQFQYAISYHLSDKNELFDPSTIVKTWESIPIVCSINENDRRIFLHTVPYASCRLMIRSSLSKMMPKMMNNYQIYSKVDRLEVYATENLTETFGILRHCRRVRDLTIMVTQEMPTTKSSDVSSANNDKQTLLALPRLNRLDILTLEGAPPDLHHLKAILLAANNLSVLVIDLECLLGLLDDEDQSLLLFVLLDRHILDLCIRIGQNNHIQQQQNLTYDHIHRIARVFNRVRNLTIDMENSKEHIEPNIIQWALEKFKQIVILYIYGKVPDSMRCDDIRQWLFDQNMSRITHTDIFRVECSKEWFKLWL